MLIMRLCRCVRGRTQLALLGRGHADICSRIQLPSVQEAMLHGRYVYLRACSAQTSALLRAAIRPRQGGALGGGFKQNVQLLSKTSSVADKDSEVCSCQSRWCIGLQSPNAALQNLVTTATPSPESDFSTQPSNSMEQPDVSMQTPGPFEVHVSADSAPAVAAPTLSPDDPAGSTALLDSETEPCCDYCLPQSNSKCALLGQAPRQLSFLQAPNLATQNCSPANAEPLPTRTPQVCNASTARGYQLCLRTH
jgi:hypothetical protein